MMKRIRTTLTALLSAAALFTHAADRANKLPPTVDPATGLPLTVEEIRFDLDVPQGRPDALVKAIEKASGMPLNVIIASEHANTVLPPMKLRDVTVPQVFYALTRASERVRSVATGYYTTQGGGRQAQYQTQKSTYGFRSNDEPPTQRSIWYFYVDNPPEPPKVDDLSPRSQCRFWQLEPYLERFKIEDITTAIETGWEMLGRSNPDSKKLSFHKDTKLLIAVGTPDELQVVDDVLRQLTSDKGSAKDKITPPPPAPRPIEPGKQ
jgi:hypothetical protein